MIGAGHRVVNWQKPMIFIDFEANDPRKLPIDPLSVDVWTFKLLNCYQTYLSYTWSSLVLLKVDQHLSLWVIWQKIHILLILVKNTLKMIQMTCDWIFISDTFIVNYSSVFSRNSNDNCTTNWRNHEWATNQFRVDSGRQYVISK